MIERLKVYGPALVVIITWWTLAFSPQSQQFTHPDPSPMLSSEASDLKSKQSFAASITINRDSLKQALAGNFALMIRLMTDWDIEAQLLQAKGFSDIQRLPNIDFLRAQILGRAIINPQKTELTRLQNESRIHEVIDDTNNILSLKVKYRRFLPQTYAAASFLLALVSPSQIVALPSRLREQVELYPKSITDRIILDIDRFNAEKLFEEEPEIAFVARYSHPSTLQALKNQGVQLYMMENLNTLQAISQELMNIGRLVGRPIEAELMKLFLFSTSMALDNKLTLLKHHFTELQRPLPTILYANYHNNFSVPTSKTLTGHFLQKMSDWDLSLKYTEEHDLHDMWTIPIDREHIVNLNPDCLIIATEHPQAIEKVIKQDEALQQILAIKKNNLYFVSECIQNSPCQYILLAYNDLIEALTKVQ